MNNLVSYKERLRLRRLEIQKQIETAPKPPTLTEKIDAWFSGLSQEDQRRSYKMTELKQIFIGETSQKIGSALFQIGFSRRRSWKDHRPCSRYWFKE